MINKVILLGNVGQDPKVFEGGKVASFTLATTRYFTVNDERKKETEWHSIVAFGKTASVVDSFVKKGDLLYIEGRIKTEEYTDRDGNKRYMTKIIADTLKLLTKKEGGENSPRNNYTDDLP